MRLSSHRASNQAQKGKQLPAFQSVLPTQHGRQRNTTVYSALATQLVPIKRKMLRSHHNACRIYSSLATQYAPNGRKKRVKRPYYNVCCVHTKEYNTVIKYDYRGLRLTIVKDDKEQF